MDRMYKFRGVFVILIVLISESRQTQEDDDLNKKISEIFGTPPPDGKTMNPYPNPNPNPYSNSYPPLTQSPPTVSHPLATQRTETPSSSSPSENNV